MLPKCSFFTDSFWNEFSKLWHNHQYFLHVAAKHYQKIRPCEPRLRERSFLARLSPAVCTSFRLYSLLLPEKYYLYVWSHFRCLFRTMLITRNFPFLMMIVPHRFQRSFYHQISSASWFGDSSSSQACLLGNLKWFENGLIHTESLCASKVEWFPQNI